MIADSYPSSLDPVSGLRDRVEIYNIPSRSYIPHPNSAHLCIVDPEFNGDFKHDHPAVVQEHLEEVEEFARVCLCTISTVLCAYCHLQSLHSEVLDKLHILLAIALELPEDYFANIHKYDVKSEVRLSSVYIASFFEHR